MNPFHGVVGHEAIVELLTSELDQPAQSYLFVGPSNVGKGLVARHFAAGIVGGGSADAVDRALRGSHPDLIFVEPEGRSSITVDQSRRVVSESVRSPLESDRKVFLFAEASLLNDEAANALLKTIEEPVAASHFILVAESEDDLPATVASRCRTIVFGRVPDGSITDGLIALGVDPERAEDVSRMSGGRPGLAVALATEPAVAAFRSAWMSVPDRLTGHPGDAYRAVDEVLAATEPLLEAVKRSNAEEIERLYPDGDVPKVVSERHQRAVARSSDALYVTGLELLASYYRDTAAAQFGADVHNTDVPVSSFTKVTPASAVENTQRILEAIEALESAQRPQLALAALFVDLATDA